MNTKANKYAKKLEAHFKKKLDNKQWRFFIDFGYSNIIEYSKDAYIAGYKAAMKSK